MATPNDRKIIFSSHAIPQISYSTTSTQETTEEGFTVGNASYTKYKLDTTVGKAFGGKGTVEITHDQSIDGWVSFKHSKNTWGGDTTSNWEDDHGCWSGELSVANGDATVLRPAGTVQFLYIKNTGSANEAKLALEGNEYDILIPPGAAVSMRVNSISYANIKVDTTSGSTTIEYIIAI